MTLNVDFNMRDKLGRVPSLVEGSELWTLEPGTLVIAEDDEGNRCKAEVAEVSPDKHVVYLRLIPGTSDPSDKTDWIADEDIAARKMPRRRFRDSVRKRTQKKPLVHE